jgi:hypothetical protein
MGTRASKRDADITFSIGLKECREPAEYTPMRAGKMIGILAVVLVYCGISFYRRFMTPTVEQTGCMVLEGSTFQQERDNESASPIVGTIRNSCDRAYSNVQISFKLNGSNDGTPWESVVVAYARDVKAGETATFKTSRVPRDSSYRLNSIRAH